MHRRHFVENRFIDGHILFQIVRVCVFVQTECIWTDPDTFRLDKYTDPDNLKQNMSINESIFNEMSPMHLILSTIVEIIHPVRDLIVMIEELFLTHKILHPCLFPVKHFCRQSPTAISTRSIGA
jgi:hypothetical protein